MSQININQRCYFKAIRARLECFRLVFRLLLNNFYICMKQTVSHRQDFSLKLLSTTNYCELNKKSNYRVK